MSTNFWNFNTSSNNHVNIRNSLKKYDNFKPKPNYSEFGRLGNMSNKANKINYDEILKSRNAIINQCNNNQNSLLANTSLSYESNRSIETFQRSLYTSKSKNRPQNNSRKSTTNLLPTASRKGKFILKNNKNG